MPLDGSTLTFAGGVVAFSSGLFMLLYWSQDRAAWPAFCWAVASCVRGCGAMLVAFNAVLPAFVPEIMAPIFNLCAALVFVAARIFNRGSINPYFAVTAGFGWMMLQILAGAYAPQRQVVALGLGISGCLYVAAAIEFWLGRAERLRGRTALIILIAAFGASLLWGAFQYACAASGPPTPMRHLSEISHFVGLVYPISVALFLTAMLKERAAAAHEAAALKDPLTGLANRRAFFEQAKRVLDRCGRDATPAALLAFDLDRFKAINDTFGHAIGDAALLTFATVLSAALRPACIVARIGGEEFVAVMPGVGEEAAVAIANRIRNAFRKQAEFVEGRRTNATVSVGVATTGGRACEVAELLASADSALYRAKNAGRNCVILAPRDGAGPAAANPARIA
jgi:diguanylate cyclase (GGDEF)-like protein